MAIARHSQSPHPSCLFPDEAEIARLILGPKRAKAWTGLAVVLERNGLPRVDPMFGGRYWPAVRTFFDRLYHVEGSRCANQAPDGAENLNALR